MCLIWEYSTHKKEFSSLLANVNVCTTLRTENVLMVQKEKNNSSWFNIHIKESNTWKHDTFTSQNQLDYKHRMLHNISWMRLMDMGR